MNRIDKAFQTCRDEQRKALVLFVSAGDPSLDDTEKIIERITEAGADIVEIGVPFSDPMADGPTIQAASQRALAAGTTLDGILQMIRRLRRKTDVPLVLFSYFNVMLQYGLEKLAADSADAGIDAWLTVDVPAEEKDEVLPLMEQQELYWITLIAPTTPKKRAVELVKDARGFVYCITVAGVTGARTELPDNLQDYLQTISDASPVPVVAGFGVSSPELARRTAEHADGVVVGSALIKAIEENGVDETGLAKTAEWVAAISAALKSES